MRWSGPGTELLAAASDLAALAGSATTATGREALAALGARLAAVRASPRRDDPWGEAERLAGLSAATKGWRTGKRDPPELLAGRERLEEAARALPLAAAELAAAPVAAALAVIVGDVERRYAEAKARAGALDFDDLLVRARDLLRDAPAVRAEVRSRVRALLVDEYQDVNGLQAEIFDWMAGAAAREAGRGGRGRGPAPRGRRRRQAVHLPVPRRRRLGLRLAHRAAREPEAGRWFTSGRTTAPRPASSTS